MLFQVGRQLCCETIATAHLAGADGRVEGAAGRNLVFRKVVGIVDGNPIVIEQSELLEIDHAPYTIVGVMPRSFAFNDTLGVGDVYLPGTLMRVLVNPSEFGQFLNWSKQKLWQAKTEVSDQEFKKICLTFYKDKTLRRVEQFATKAQARAKVAAWIEDYNRNRRHSSLQMMSPADYEQALQSGQAA